MGWRGICCGGLSVDGSCLPSRRRCPSFEELVARAPHVAGIGVHLRSTCFDRPSCSARQSPSSGQANRNAGTTPCSYGCGPAETTTYASPAAPRCPSTTVVAGQGRCLPTCPCTREAASVRSGHAQWNSRSPSGLRQYSVQATGRPCSVSRSAAVPRAPAPPRHRPHPTGPGTSLRTPPSTQAGGCEFNWCWPGVDHGSLVAGARSRRTPPRVRGMPESAAAGLPVARSTLGPIARVVARAEGELSRLGCTTGPPSDFGRAIAGTRASPPQARHEQRDHPCRSGGRDRRRQ